MRISKEEATDMIERKRVGDLIPTLFMLIFFAALATFSYYVFFEPEKIGLVTKPRAAALEQMQMASNPANRKIILYFANENSTGLVGEERDIIKVDKKLDLARKILEELIVGPRGKGCYRTIPETAAVRAVFIVGRTLVVDFSRELATDHPGGVSSELMTIYSVVDSLSEIGEIDNVQLLINGEASSTLSGRVSILRPIFPDRTLIQKI
jgi:germination protein M